MRHSHDFPPYHFGIKARKPQSAEAGICSHQWHRGLQACPIARLHLNTHDGQNLPLGKLAGIDCYLASHI